MRNRKIFIPGYSALLIAALAAFILLFSAIQAARAQSTAATQGVHAEAAQNTPTPMATEAPSWIILDTLPVTATQADYGAEIYRLVCKACHGDRGQGLTGDWIAQWPPEDQNCWQAKCHHETIHPPDGFALPHFVPAVIGPNELRRFDTALDLYEYNRATMPWHAPGTMLDREYWQVTAFLLRENKIDPAIDPLDSERAANLRLYPVANATQEPDSARAPEPTQALPPVAPTRSPLVIWSLVALVVIGSAAILIFLRK